jgi:phage FluMu protein gp41
LIDEARAEAARIVAAREAAEAEAGAASQRAKEALREQVANAGCRRCRAILRKEINAQAHAELLTQLKSELQSAMAENVTLARPYAEAAFQLASRRAMRWGLVGSAVGWRRRRRSEMEECIGNPAPEPEQLARALPRCVAGKPDLSAEQQNFVRVLADNDRLHRACPRSGCSTSSSTNTKASRMPKISRPSPRRCHAENPRGRPRTQVRVQDPGDRQGRCRTDRWRPYCRRR